MSNESRPGSGTAAHQPADDATRIDGGALVQDPSVRVHPRYQQMFPVLTCGVSLDSKGFVLTGTDLGDGARSMPLQTSLAAVFAIGDVRSASTKRVASAVGEGAAVVAQIHSLLAMQGKRTGRLSDAPLTGRRRCVFWNAGAFSRQPEAQRSISVKDFRSACRYASIQVETVSRLIA